MKVKITLELDLPEVKDDNVNLQNEYVKGITWEMAHISQSIFDNFLNYSICSHLRDAMRWMGRNKDTPNSKMIAKQHNLWADILRKSESTMKIEKI